MINLDGMTDDEKMAALESIHQSIADSKEVQKKKITSNVEMIVKALKKIESDIKQRYDQTGALIESIKNGADGQDGKDGKNGKDGRNGKDGAVGPRGFEGAPGRDGLDGQDGVSIVDAQIHFDGGLTITLSDGRIINAGEIVNPDTAENIKVITNGGGTSQFVLDTLASLQAQISAISSGLNYQGTWNASTNVPTLTSSVGTAGYYYIVATAGSTNLNGVTDWQVGDWAIFNGSVWQKLDQTNLVTSVAGRTGAIVLTTADIGGLGTIATQAASAVAITGGSINATTVGASTASTGAFTTLSASSTATLSALTASTALALDASKNIVSVTNTGTGSNVLATSPTLVTPALGTPSALVGTNITGTASGLTAGTVTTNANLTGAVTSVGNATSLGSFTSAQLSGALTDETGSGSAVFATSPTLVTPALGTPSSGVVTNLTGTASININGTVGATTATTGAFTTLTTSSTVTLNGGTANGVLYLNGSKVATSGTAITFDGSRLLVGTTTAGVTTGGIRAVHDATEGTPTAVGDEVGWVQRNFNSAQSCALAIVSGTASTSSLYLGDKDSISVGSVVYSNSDNSMRFNTSATEGMRLTSTGLGIGTSSPSGKLTVANTYTNTSDATIVASSSIPGINLRSTSTGRFSIFTSYNASNSTSFLVGTGTSNPSTVAMYIDHSTGNLNVGTTTSLAKITAATSSANSTGIRLDNGSSLANNYISIDFGLQGLATSSGYSAFIRGYNSGAANQTSYLTFGTNPATATEPSERMRIDADGNVGIGTTSPASRLHVTGTFGSQLRLQETSGTFFDITGGGRLDIKNNAGTTIVSIAQSGNPVGTQLNLNSSGNLGVGVVPSAWVTYKGLQVGGSAALWGPASTGSEAYVNANTYYDGTNRIYISTNPASEYSQVSGVHRWKTAASGTAGNAITFTQAMTLTEAGNLGLGTTAPTGASGITFAVNGSAGQTRIALKNSTTGDATGDGFQIVLDAGSADVGFEQRENAAIRFITNNVEALRITNGQNVGIGTTTPAVLLTVASASADTGKILIQSGTLTNNNRAGLFMSAINVNGQTGNVSIECLHPNNQQSDMVFRTGATDANSFGTERMRLDTLGSLGIGATANASALLDVQSTTKGVRMPNMTTTQKNAIASPAAGLMVFDTTLAKLCVYSGTAWQTITSV